jgi:hypothetical protein
MAKYGSARYKNSLYGSAVEHPYALVTDRVMWDLHRRDRAAGDQPLEDQAWARQAYARGWAGSDAPREREL